MGSLLSLCVFGGWAGAQAVGWPCISSSSDGTMPRDGNGKGNFSKGSQAGGQNGVSFFGAGKGGKAVLPRKCKCAGKDGCGYSWNSFDGQFCVSCRLAWDFKLRSQQLTHSGHGGPGIRTEGFARSASPGKQAQQGPGPTGGAATGGRSLSQPPWQRQDGHAGAGRGAKGKGGVWQQTGG